MGQLFVVLNSVSELVSMKIHGQPNRVHVVNLASITVVSDPSLKPPPDPEVGPDRTPRQNLHGSGTFLAGRGSSRSLHLDELVVTAEAVWKPGSGSTPGNDFPCSGH